MLPELVSEVAATAMLQHFLTKEVVGPGGRLVPMSQLPRGTCTAAYPLRTICECPGVLDLVNNPMVLRLAAAYLGCKPTLSSLGLRWSFPGSGPTEASQTFHRDPDDWRFLKLFVYLTDVGSRSGPHAYIAGSHLTAGRIRARPYSELMIRRQFGSGRLRAITGRRGTAFLADTYGIHAGMAPKEGSRLLLLAQYSILPVYCFQYNPLSLRVATLLDPYINRLLLQVASGN